MQHGLEAGHSCSATVGTSGNFAERLIPVTASARNLPSFTSPTAGGSEEK